MGQDSISRICISKSVAETWHPCEKNKNSDKGNSGKNGRRLLDFLESDQFSDHRRSLATKGYDKCAEKARKT